MVYGGGKNLNSRLIFVHRSRKRNEKENCAGTGIKRTYCQYMCVVPMLEGKHGLKIMKWSKKESVAVLIVVFHWFPHSAKEKSFKPQNFNARKPATPARVQTAEISVEGTSTEDFVHWAEIHVRGRHAIKRA